jgi:hypothetical protein
MVKPDGLVISPEFVMPVPGHVRDDGSACPAPRCGGIQNILKSLDSGYRIVSGTDFAGMTF